MITGFNTDIQHEGVTYHVQTEDKGLETPLILSLVYVGGAIIASKRTPYEDLLTGGFDEKVLTERLSRQHKLICAAIRAGRVADLKRMGGPAGQEKPAEAEGRPLPERTRTQRRKKSEAAQATVDAGRAVSQAGATAAESSREVSKNGAGVSGEAKAGAASEPRATDGAGVSVEAQVISAGPQIDGAEAAGEARTQSGAGPTGEVTSEASAGVTSEAGAPVEAADAGRAGEGVAEAGEAAGGAGKSLGDEIVILTTLVDEIEALGGVKSYQPPVFKSEPIEKLPLHEDIPVAPPPPPPPAPQVEQPAPPQGSTDELYLTLLDDEGDFRAGQLVMVKVHVGRGTYGRLPVADAQVTVKVLGTTFRPLILTSVTDATGMAVVRALLPRFTSGRAAIIIRAVDGEDAAEIRRIIHQA